MIRRVILVLVLSGSFILLTSLFADQTKPLMPTELDELAIRPSMVDGLTAEQRELVDEYRRQYLEVVRLYRNIKMVAKSKDFILGQTAESGEPFARSVLTYRSNGGTHLRMDEQWLDGDGTANGRKLVRLARPQGYLAADRPNKASEFTIFETHPSFDEGENAISGYFFQWAPHSVSAQPAHRYLFSNWVDNLFEGYRITKVTVDQEVDAELVSFHVSGKSKLRNGRESEHKFVFDRSKGWVLAAYRLGFAQIASDDEYVRHAEFEYSGTSDGIGLLSGARYWIAVGPQGEEQTEREFEVVEVVPGPVPLREFSPEAIGIGRPGRQRVDRIWTVVGLLIGGGLIALYGFLRRRESLARSRP